MFIKSVMNTNVVYVSSDKSLSSAFEILHKENVTQLPVVDDGILVGALTEKILNEFAPSKATSLSIYEVNHIFQKTKVKDIMQTNIISCNQDDLISSAITQMLKSDDHDVNMVPVTDNNNHIVGLITRFDLIKSFGEILSIDDNSSSRIAIYAKNQVGVAAEVSAIISEQGYNITHFSNFNDENDHSYLMIGLEKEADDNLTKALIDKGYEIVHTEK